MECRGGDRCSLRDPTVHEESVYIGVQPDNTREAPPALPSS